MRNNSQAAADVLVKQAQATSQVEEMVQSLFVQLKAGAEERIRLQQLLLQERAQLMAQAEEAQALHQRLHTTEHRSTAVQVVTESLQSQLAQAREALETSNRERQQLADKVKQLAEELAVTTECRTRGDKLIAEQAAVIDALRQQLQDQASTASTLAEDKAQLEAQLQGVLQAEQELTVHLRETHAAIEGQLAALRDQLKTERQKRAAVVKRRGELQAQVEQLQAQLVAQQAEMAALIGGTIPSQPRAQQQSQGRSAAGIAGSHTAPAVAAKAAGHSSAYPRSAGAASTGHAAPSRSGVAGAAAANGAAGNHVGTTAGGAAVAGRGRPAARSAGGAIGSSRQQAPSPPSGASKVGGAKATLPRHSSVPRSASPGAELSDADDLAASNLDLDGTSMGATSTLRIPSSLSQPVLGFAAGSPTKPEDTTAAGVSDDEPPTARAVTPVQPLRLGHGAAVEGQTPSPSSRQAQAFTREGGRAQTANSSRRRSISPGPSRASLNALQHARRASPALGRTATARSASPGTGAVGTWLP